MNETRYLHPAVDAPARALRTVARLPIVAPLLLLKAVVNVGCGVLPILGVLVARPLNSPPLALVFLFYRLLTLLGEAVLAYDRQFIVPLKQRPWTWHDTRRSSPTERL